MSNVEYDIFKSKYKVEYGSFYFYFSSEFNKNRFEERINDFIINETNKLKAKFHVNIKLEMYLAFVLYKRIEKRGFRVEIIYDNRRIPEDIIFFDSIGM